MSTKISLQFQAKKQPDFYHNKMRIPGQCSQNSKTFPKYEHFQNEFDIRPL